MISEYKPDSEFYTLERCHIIELHNHDEDKACSTARARVEPGVTTQLHVLKGISERYVILEGEGRVEVGSSPPTAVRPLDVVNIPADVPQKITNTGEADLVFLCVCTPRFRPESYVNHET